MTGLLSLLASVALVSGAATEPDIRPGEGGDACAPSARQLRVAVDGIEAATGILTVELYRNDQGGFLRKTGRLRRVREAARAGTQRVCLGVEGEGPFAVAVYHDVNGNRDLDQKWNKMPKEPFGLSGEARLRLGFPDIEPALVTVPDDGLDVVIALRDPR